MNYCYDNLDRPVINYNNDDYNSTGYHTVFNANENVGLLKDTVINRQTRYTYDVGLPAAEDADGGRAEHGVPVRRERPAGEEDGERRGDHLPAGYERPHPEDDEGVGQPGVPVRHGRRADGVRDERSDQLLLSEERAGGLGKLHLEKYISAYKDVKLLQQSK